MRYARADGPVRLLLVVLLLALPGLAAGRIIEVMPGKSGTIGDVLDQAVAGDAIYLGCGTYDESLLAIPDGVTLAGACGTPDGVVIRSWGYVSLIQVADAPLGVEVGNLTLTLVDPAEPRSQRRGDAALLGDAKVRFSQVVFRDFEAGYGGAVSCQDGSEVTFEDCVFEDNEARAAGGAVVAAGGSVLAFERCLFVDNRTDGAGGAINVALGASASLISCTLVGSEAALGGAIASFDAAAVSIEQTIVARGQGGAVWIGDGSNPAGITCSDLYDNAGGDFVGVLEVQLGQDGNISTDPLFCGAAHLTNPYTLNASSPCLPPNSACGPVGAFGQGCDLVADVPGGRPPAVSRLHEASPNPFNPRTTIKYDVRDAGAVSIAIYDVSGRLVRRLVDRVVAPGTYEATWEGRDQAGRSAAAGVYFFRLETADTIDTKRMTLVK